MRHGARTQSFSRPFNQRKWLMRNLAVSLVEHERIRTTLAKAKELRRVVEKAVTLGKRGSMADRRLLMSRIPNESLVQKIFTVLAPRYSSRSGGYTRILKMSRRPGDNSEMALIEFIDAQIKGAQTTDKKAKKTKAASAEKSAKAAAKKEAKKVAKEAKAAGAERAKKAAKVEKPAKKEASPKAKKAKSK